MSQDYDGGRLDNELEELFGDRELQETARLLSAVRAPEPPLDPAFRSALRRELMREAWEMAEPKLPWWRRLVAPPALAWAAASVGTILLAFVAFNFSSRPSDERITVGFPEKDAQAVALEKPIEIDFSQPMDHPSVEAAVTIQPPTRVSYEWQGNKLLIRPTNGQLAPNTQYQVQITGSARTASQKPVPPTEARFVTASPPSPKPAPQQPSPPAPVSAERQLVPPTIGRLIGWSPDGKTLYFLGAAGQLQAVGAEGGAARTFSGEAVKQAVSAPDGSQFLVSGSTAISLVSSDGKTDPIEIGKGDASALAFGQSAAGAVTRAMYLQGSTVYGVSLPLAPQPAAGKLVSVKEQPSGAYFAPAGDRLLYRGASGTHLVDLTTGHETDWPQGVQGAVAWAPDGRHVGFVGSDGIYLADPFGQSPSRIATFGEVFVKSGDALELAWSSHDQILASAPAGLYGLHADGSTAQAMAAGEFGQPTWNQAGNAIASRRAGGAWTAQVSFAPPPAGNLDDGYRTISGFMDERLRRNAQGASTYLDASGQAAFKASGAPALVVSDEPALSRYFVVFGQPVAGTNGGLRFVVRLVLAKGNVDITAYDEVLVLQRDPAGKLLVHQVSAGSRQPVGKGPEVISTQLDRNQVRVAFNADLQPANAPEVVVKDSSGRVLDAMATYSGRTYTLTLPPLTPGATYRVSVLPGVKDISGRSIAAEYDLDFVAPAS